MALGFYLQSLAPTAQSGDASAGFELADCSSAIRARHRQQKVNRLKQPDATSPQWRRSGQTAFPSTPVGGPLGVKLGFQHDIQGDQGEY